MSYIHKLCCASGKKGKDTPVSNDLAPTVTMPSKPATQMKKRGEEDLDSKYLSMVEIDCNEPI